MPRGALWRGHGPAAGQDPAVFFLLPGRCWVGGRATGGVHAAPTSSGKAGGLRGKWCLPGRSRGGVRPRPTNCRERPGLFFTFRQAVGAACRPPVGVHGGNGVLRDGDPFPVAVGRGCTPPWGFALPGRFRADAAFPDSPFSEQAERPAIHQIYYLLSIIFYLFSFICSPLPARSTRTGIGSTVPPPCGSPRPRPAGPCPTGC